MPEHGVVSYFSAITSPMSETNHDHIKQNRLFRDFLYKKVYVNVRIITLFIEHFHMKIIEIKSVWCMYVIYDTIAIHFLWKRFLKIQ